MASAGSSEAGSRRRADAAHVGAVARPTRAPQGGGTSLRTHQPAMRGRRRRCLSLLSFPAPTGLAVGLALKESRYARSYFERAIRPRPHGHWFPRVPAFTPELRPVW